MKYIKKFEDNIEVEYQVGDFIKLKSIPDYIRGVEDIEENLYAIIESKNFNYYPTELYGFKLLLTEKVIYGYIYMISRKMTSKEVEEYKIKIESKKYNL